MSATDQIEPSAVGPVEVTYRLSDLFAINFRAWRVYLRGLLIVEAFFVALVIGYPLLDGYSFWEAIVIADWWFPLGMGVLLLVLWFTLCPLIGYLSSKRQGFLGPNRFSLSDEGIKVASTSTESLIYWSGIKRVTASKKRLYLFISSTMAYILPASVFSSANEFQRWIELATERWRRAQ